MLIKIDNFFLHFFTFGAITALNKKWKVDLNTKPFKFNDLKTSAQGLWGSRTDGRYR